MNTLTASEISKCLRNDIAFKSSIGLQYSHMLIKGFGIVWVLSLMIFVLTPLPQVALISRIGLLAAIFGSGICLGLDWILNSAKIDEAAERLFDIMSEDPNIEFTQMDNGYKITHAKFTAECSQLTKLNLAGMLQSKSYLKNLLGKLGSNETKEAEMPITNQNIELKVKS